MLVDEIPALYLIVISTKIFGCLHIFSTGAFTYFYSESIFNKQNFC